MSLLATLLLAFGVSLPRASAATAATLVLRPSTVAAGGTVKVIGTGFKSSALIAVWVDFSTRSGIQRSTVTAHSSAGGGLTASLPVPAAAIPGTYSVIATDYLGHRVTARLQVVLGVVLHAGAAPSLAAAAPGDRLAVSGSGFTPDASVTVQITFRLYSGPPVSVHRTVQTGASGGFTGVNIVVPYGTREGVTRLQAADAEGALATAAISVEYHPTVTVHPSPIPTGATFSVNGQGFIPRSRVKLTFTGKGARRIAYSGTTSAGPKGRIQKTIRAGHRFVPGRYALLLSTPGGVTLVSTSTAVTAGPALSAGKLSVSAGAALVVYGYHFPAGSHVSLTTLVPIAGGHTRTVTGSTDTGPGGNFAATIRFPLDAVTGQAQIKAQSGRVSVVIMVPVTLAPTQVVVAPAEVSPGETVSVSGTGFTSGVDLVISATLSLTDGTTSLITRSAAVGSTGAFRTSFVVPENAAAGVYDVSAASSSPAASATTHLTVIAATPALLTLPGVAAPGTTVTVTGFAFPPRSPVALSLGGVNVGTATADDTGRFFEAVPVPASSSIGNQVIQAVSGTTSVSSEVRVTPTLTTRVYFPSLYTGAGYHEYIAILNPTESQAHVSIAYLRAGARRVRVALTVPPHTRVTEDVNADLGPHVSAAAVVTADQPVAAERLVRHLSDIAVDPGSPKPAAHWYFAAGNTSHGYREYVSAENPNKQAVEVAFNFMPAHNRPFTLFKTVGASSRLTINVNLYVQNDAVSVEVSAARAIVASRTTFIKSGMSSKTGVSAPSKAWYFAAGPRQTGAVNWISVLNPQQSAAMVDLAAYGIHGGLLTSIHRRIGPGADASFLMNQLAQHADVSVTVMSTLPVVAEQATYAGAAHHATTADFGAAGPAKSAEFAAMGTRPELGESDSIDVFNPAESPAAIVVEYLTAAGTTFQQSLFVGPRSREIINVGLSAGNVQLGATLISSLPVVVLNRYSADGGTAADTSIGVRPAG